MGPVRALVRYHVQLTYMEVLDISRDFGFTADMLNARCWKCEQILKCFKAVYFWLKGFGPAKKETA